MNLTRLDLEHSAKYNKNYIVEWLQLPARKSAVKLPTNLSPIKYKKVNKQKGRKPNKTKKATKPTKQTKSTQMKKNLHSKGCLHGICFNVYIKSVVVIPLHVVIYHNQ